MTIEMRRRDRRLPGGESGFSLAEMLVALGLIATAVFALLGGLITAARSIQSQQENARATRVALDVYENLRLKDWDNDPALQVTSGTPATAQAVGANGEIYNYVTVVSERLAPVPDGTPGQLIKDITTTVTWRISGKTRTVRHTSSLARDARTIGLPNGYVQAVRSMSVAPDPSVIVDFDGYTQEPIYVTVSLTGFDVSDNVVIGWTDDSGARTATATTTDARFWRLTIPAGSSGIKKNLEPQTSAPIAFTARTATGLTASSTLTVFGPVTNRPVISSFGVSPAPIKVFSNGGSRFQNKDDEVVTCVIDGLDVTANSRDSVKLIYPGETGAGVEVPLQRIAISGAVATYQHTFVRSTTYFGLGNNQSWSCVARRASDGGPASKVALVSVTR